MTMITEFEGYRMYLSGIYTFPEILAKEIIGDNLRSESVVYEQYVRNIITALILYVDQNSMYKPEEKNLNTVYKIITNRRANEIKLYFDSFQNAWFIENYISDSFFERQNIDDILSSAAYLINKYLQEK